MVPSGSHVGWDKGWGAKMKGYSSPPENLEVKRHAAYGGRVWAVMSLAEVEIVDDGDTPVLPIAERWAGRDAYHYVAHPLIEMIDVLVSLHRTSHDAR